MFKLDIRMIAVSICDIFDKSLAIFVGIRVSKSKLCLLFQGECIIKAHFWLILHVILS